MGKGGCNREAARVVLWMLWVTVWLLTSIYVLLAVITFAQLWQAASELSYGLKDITHNKIWRAPLASLVLSALLTFGFNMTSCVTLIKKSVNRAGPGFSYGFMVAFSFSLSFFLLLCGLVLDGFRHEVKQSLEPQTYANGTTYGGVSNWSTYNSQAFIGTEVLALLSFCTYFLFGFALVFLQSAISDQLGINSAAGYDMGPAYAQPIPTNEVKDLPAAPPDYEQYAQYSNEQYSGGYTAAGVGYGANNNYQAPSQQQGMPVGGAAAAYIAAYPPAAPDYENTSYSQQGSYETPQASYIPNTGYAAVGTYNVTAAAGQESQGGQQYQQGQHQQL
mmetsp:Transcript_4537/g.7717  ORF Transcript_4537/g.7717 Transcript_4537/m.7717 type:complete len:333 (-) Transcript_4537:930-1928(-)|eukprot:CAMPEP_0119101784 /NCGR_PEP_ID=MMETSP1180-20130426/738_1 /TAXON_ID=3052 ORGANISM="Chlamydomonas cf sp, Strain CCMP681" /NCGR_SAMPLE_ID=MMETSP1180 /ASSEMBLY_ACC=CAM_ASM_000741 /LENGTH=332 /DNA_ID=CAMNT_0007085957 /DNA_START=99 /DNA_END=1097 /DNA_ORIENTATION=+